MAFLNKSGGDIYLGIDDNKNVIGINDIDGTQCEIKDRLKHNIEPSIMGLFDVNVVQRDGKKIIKVTVATGVEATYYLKIWINRKRLFCAYWKHSRTYAKR